MAKSRKSKQSSDKPAHRSPAESHSGEESLRRRFLPDGRVATMLLCMLSAALLSVCFVPAGWWPAAYVALVPFVLGISSARRPRWALLWGYLAGVLFWAGNLYWLTWVTLVGYFPLILYLSAYWLVAALVIRSAMRRRMWMWIVLPVVWTALEYARAYVISGFPWFFLAHSQYARIELIQIADTTGQYGVSFFVAMVNGAILDILMAILRPRGVKRRLKRSFTGLAVTLAAGGAMISYGVWRVGQETTRPGPVIGIVQQAFPISLGGRNVSGEKIFADHLNATRKFLGSRCDLVLWPETMLPHWLNAEFLTLDPAGLSRADLRSLAMHLMGPDAAKLTDEEALTVVTYCLRGQPLPQGGRGPSMADPARRIGEASKELGCPILAGGSTIHQNFAPINDVDRWTVRNSMLWFDGSWKSSGVYSKMHLVPFSEYVPFKHTWTDLHRLLRRFVPPVMQQLEPGPTAEVFHLRSEGHNWRLAGVICYEGTFARVCRRLSMKNGKKRIDVLLNLSNDGWFVYKLSGQSYRGSAEHPQHLVQYCFRAVENRLPVVRSVNTGISASIDSNGRIVCELGLTVDDYRKRTMVSGTLLLDGRVDENGTYIDGHGPQVLVDSRVSLYSLAGDAFAMVVSAAAIVLAAWLLWERRKGRITKSAEKKDKR